MLLVNIGDVCNFMQLVSMVFPVLTIYAISSIIDNHFQHSYIIIYWLGLILKYINATLKLVAFQLTCMSKLLNISYLYSTLIFYLFTVLYAQKIVSGQYLTINKWKLDSDIVKYWVCSVSLVLFLKNLFILFYFNIEFEK